jgi:hypothetical protein
MYTSFSRMIYYSLIYFKAGIFSFMFRTHVRNIICSGDGRLSPGSYAIIYVHTQFHEKEFNKILEKVRDVSGF